MVTLKLAAIVIAAILWTICFVSQFMLIFNRKPGTKLFQLRLIVNPFFMQFGGRYYLSERGIYWRNISWISAVLFAMVIMLSSLFFSDEI